MDLSRGSILLARSLDESNIFQNEKWLKVFIWCLIQANHKGRNVPVNIGRAKTSVWVDRGQFIFGRNKAAEKLGMSPSTVRNIMQKLVDFRNMDMQKDTHFSIVTVLEYDLYQTMDNYKGQAKGQAEDKQRTADGQPEDTTKTPKSPNNVNPTLAPEPESYQIPETLLKWSEKKGISTDLLNEYIKVCLTWHSSKGNKYTKWDKTIQTWINKDLKGNYNKGKNTGKNFKVDYTGPQYKSGLVDISEIDF